MRRAYVNDVLVFQHCHMSACCDNRLTLLTDDTYHDRKHGRLCSTSHQKDLHHFCQKALQLISAGDLDSHRRCDHCSTYT